MSSLLPVLQENHPMMSMCNWCPEPGHCCKKFQLSAPGNGEYGTNFSFWKGDRDGTLARRDAEAELERRGVPFVIHSVDEEWRTERGHHFVRFYFCCPELLPSGRCGIYEERPDLCRSFIPGSDDLCLVKGAP